MSDKPSLHCWGETPDDEDGMSTTCMRERGHNGSCEPTRDDRIGITFEPSPDLGPTRRGEPT
jgi:hypothetical protein